MSELTERQTAILAFITTYIATNGYAPTLREIGEALGLAHTGIREHLERLETKGFVKLGQKKQRAITVLKQPEAP